MGYVLSPCPQSRIKASHFDAGLVEHPKHTGVGELVTYAHSQELDSCFMPVLLGGRGRLGTPVRLLCEKLRVLALASSGVGVGVGAGMGEVEATGASSRDVGRRSESRPTNLPPFNVHACFCV